MSIENAKNYLKQFGMDDRVVELSTSSATVDLAAAALQVVPGRIAKTLSFKRGDSCVLIVAAGDARIDNKKFKADMGFGCKMLKPEDALRLTGYAVGGVCPFGIPEDIPIYLDKSLGRYEIVFPACGSSNSMIEITIDDLFRVSRAERWVDVCNSWV